MKDPRSYQELQLNIIMTHLMLFEILYINLVLKDNAMFHFKFVESK